MINFLLYVISLVLSLALLTFGIAYGFVRSFIGLQIGTALRRISLKFRTLATAIDIYGNVSCQELFNDTLIKSRAKVRFGAYGMTISEVLGHAQKTNALTRVGWGVVKILNLIEKDHCLKAIAEPS